MAKKKGGPVRLELRITARVPRGAPKPTPEDALGALQTLLDTGSMPRNWFFAVMDWTNPDKASRSWKQTRDESIAAGPFGDLLQAAIRRAQVSVEFSKIATQRGGVRIGEVRP